MCRQVNGCWNWVGHEFVYEKGRTNGSDGPAPKESPIPADQPIVGSPHTQEQVDVLYAILKGKPVNQAGDVAESTAAAVLGRTAVYTGQQVLWQDMMVDPAKKPELYGQQLRPTAEDFEKGTVVIPQEGVLPIPGTPA
jgi:hypothetical protein